MDHKTHHTAMAGRLVAAVNSSLQAAERNSLSANVSGCDSDEDSIMSVSTQASYDALRKMIPIKGRNSSGEKPVRCSSCSGRHVDAIIYCDDCKLNFCSYHQEVHENLVGKSHSIDWLKIEPEKSKYLPLVDCNQHANYKVSAVCKECLQLFCPVCDTTGACGSDNHEHVLTTMHQTRLMSEKKCQAILQSMKAKQSKIYENQKKAMQKQEISLSEAKMMLSEVEKREMWLMKQIEMTASRKKMHVASSAMQIKQDIDDYVNTLKKRYKCYEDRMVEIDEDIQSFNNHVVDSLKTRSTPDLMKEINLFCKKMTELEKKPVFSYQVEGKALKLKNEEVLQVKLLSDVPVGLVPSVVPSKVLHAELVSGFEFTPVGNLYVYSNYARLGECEYPSNYSTQYKRVPEIRIVSAIFLDDHVYCLQSDRTITKLSTEMKLVENLNTTGILSGSYIDMIRLKKSICLLEENDGSVEVMNSHGGELVQMPLLKTENPTKLASAMDGTLYALDTGLQMIVKYEISEWTPEVCWVTKVDDVKVMCLDPDTGVILTASGKGVNTIISCLNNYGEIIRVIKLPIRGRIISSMTFSGDLLVIISRSTVHDKTFYTEYYHAKFK